MVKPFKNELELNDRLKAQVNKFHILLDSIFAGIIEPGRSNTSLPYVGADITASLSENSQSIHTLLNDAFKFSFRVDLNAVKSPILRILSVQNDSPVREVGIRTIKGSLPILHEWAWRELSILASILESYLLIAEISDLLKKFLTRYHIKLSEGVGLRVFCGILNFLVDLGNNGGLDSLVDGISKALIDQILSVLSLKEDPTELGLLRSGKQTDGASDVDDLTCITVLKFLKVSMGCPRFQVSLPPSTRHLLIQRLVVLMDKFPLNTLEALSSTILDEQPASLSKYLPILIRYLTLCLHSNDGELKRIAMDISRQVDYIIRPRRALVPIVKNVIVESASTNEVRGVAEEVKLNIDPITVKVSHVESMAITKNNYNTITQLPPRPSTSTLQTLSSRPIQDVTEMPQVSIPEPTISSLLNQNLGKRNIGLSQLSDDEEPLPKLIDEDPDE